jgi:hypothetical protein
MQYGTSELICVPVQINRQLPRLHPRSYSRRASVREFAHGFVVVHCLLGLRNGFAGYGKRPKFTGGCITCVRHEPLSEKWVGIGTFWLQECLWIFGKHGEETCARCAWKLGGLFWRIHFSHSHKQVVHYMLFLASEMTNRECSDVGTHMGHIAAQIKQAFQPVRSVLKRSLYCSEMLQTTNKPYYMCVQYAKMTGEVFSRTFQCVLHISLCEVHLCACDSTCSPMCYLLLQKLCACYSEANSKLILSLHVGMHAFPGS